MCSWTMNVWYFENHCTLCDSFWRNEYNSGRSKNRSEQIMICIISLKWWLDFEYFGLAQICMHGLNHTPSLDSLGEEGDECF